MFSLIITTYNRNEDLFAALFSALDSCMIHEIIIVNDNPENEIFLPIDDGRIKLITNKENIGLAASRNVGWKNSTNEFILFLDDDDLIIPKNLDKILKLIVVDSSKYDVVFTPYLVTRSSYDFLRKIPVDLFATRFLRNFIGNSLIIRKTLLIDLDGYDESLRAREDYDLNLRVLNTLLNSRAHFLNYSLPWRKVNQKVKNRMSSDPHKMILSGLQLFIKHYDSMTSSERLYFISRLTSARVLDFLVVLKFYITRHHFLNFSEKANFFLVASKKR